MKVLVPLFTALMAAGAYIRIPIPPVPITLQTLFLFLAMLLLPPRESAYSMVLYLILGIIGLPVFTSGGGIAAVTGPTGGFLLGMLIAAFIGAFLAKRKHDSVLWNVIVAVIADIIIYIPGILWLMHSTGMTLPAAISGGLIPFIPGDAIKIVIAAISAKALYPQCKSLLERKDREE